MLNDEMHPFWVYQDELLVAIWYLRVPTSNNTVTATDYDIMISWELPVPPVEVFYHSTLHQAVYYTHLKPKEGSFSIKAHNQIQQDQAKWKKVIDGNWIYLEVPKITSIKETEFSFSG